MFRRDTEVRPALVFGLRHGDFAFEGDRPLLLG